MTDLTKTPDLTNFDWIVVNTSGGKDSQVMIDLLGKKLAAEGLMDRAVVVHCDLGRMEWNGTRELAERQARAAGFERFEVVSRTRDILSQVEFEREKFPSPAIRTCTSDHKTSQVAKLFTRLIKETRANGIAKKRPVRIVSALGFTPDESGQRAEKCSEITRKTPKQWNTSRNVTTWYPLHDWNIQSVWNHIKTNELEYHPAYDLGMSRLSCVFCIMASKNDLLIAGQQNPELLAEYVRVEKKIGFTFQPKLALADIQEELIQIGGKKIAPTKADAYAPRCGGL